METADRILTLLRRASVVSGEALSSTLGISRAAVWKHVEALRAEGYRIESQRARGYTLAGAPDRLIPAEIERHLTTERFGRRLECFETIDSTNVYAARLAREDTPEGTLVLAERQTRGRGRLGRSWVSPARMNLYASFVLRPRLAPADAPQLALAAAVAVARALAPLAAAAEVPVAIKWPNDCLLDGRKVAGILTEMDAEVDRIRSVVLGIGVNLNAPARAFPPELRETATSVLLATGTRVDRPRFAAALCATLEAVYDRVVRDGFATIASEWESYSCLTGREVTVDCSGRRSTGTVRGIDPVGRLVLDGANGEERIMAGDVSIVNGYRRKA
jgi:BirA family biotin operon repressor/biotin-[acetyl-CoA-carboxylase] ligase